jgi:two-component system OmpR family response regulator
MRILIIEDDREAADAMARGLTEGGHDVSAADDGEEGLIEARKGNFDVLVVDRMMPKMDGVAVVETLRREGDQTPVLFLSALGEVNDRVS